MKTLLSLLLLAFAFIVKAQDPTIEWQNTIGGNASDYLKSIQQTADGGYILGGYSGSGISGDKTEASQGGTDYWVIKLDAVGNIVWQNTIGGSDWDWCYSVRQTRDGGYILGGYSGSGISGDKTEASQGYDDCWIIKLDSTGNIIWQRTIGGNFNDGIESLQQTADGGYILGANSQAWDYWVIKLDSVGNIVWQNTIGGNNSDYLYSIQQTADEGYILGGYSESGISGDKTEAAQGSFDYWVIKLDAVGNILWQNTIGGSDWDQLYSIQQTLDGGYILGGYSYSGISGDKTEAIQGSGDYWVIKLDAAGNIVWQNTIGGSYDDKLYSIYQSADEGYILGGYSYSGISGDKTESVHGQFDYWVIKLDATGNIVWQNTIGGSDEDRLYSISQTADGGYILGSYSSSGISGDKNEASQGAYDYWVVKLNSCAALNNIVLNAVNATSCGGTDGTVYVSVLYGNSNYTYQWSPVSGTDSFLTGLPAGVYYVTVSDGSCSITDSAIVSQACGSVNGHVFNDANGNGINEAGEAGKAGVTVRVNPGGSTDITNQNGDYSISVGAYDTFTVQILPLPRRYYCSGTAYLPDTVSSPPGNLHTVIITPADSISNGNDFGLKPAQSPCGTISGYVFDDVNGNGIDDGEPRKSGMVVELTNGQSAVTDFYGMYSVEVSLNVPVSVSIAPAPGSYFCGAGQPYFF